MFVFQIPKSTWKTQVDPRMKVAWFSEDLNNENKVSLRSGIKSFDDNPIENLNYKENKRGWELNFGFKNT